MWFSIHIDQPQNPLFQRRRWALSSSSVSVGRGIDNDLLFFHPEVPRCAGKIEWKGFSLLWESKNGQQVNCIKQAVNVGPYRIQGTYSSWVKWASLFWTMFCLFLFWKSVQNKEPLPAPTQSVTENITILPAPDTYGNPSGTKETNRVEFRFLQESKVVLELHFTAGNIIEPEQLEIFVNDHSLGFVAPCPERWGSEERIHLDPAFVRSGENLIRFVNRPGKRKGKVWGVRNLYVTRLAQDQVTFETGESWFEKAKQAFDQRTTKPGQIWRARLYLNKAMNSWHRQIMKIPEKALEFQHMLTVEEKRMINRIRSEAKAALSVGDKERASSVYKNLIAEFVDPNDPRRAQFEEERRELLK